MYVEAIQHLLLKYYRSTAGLGFLHAWPWAKSPAQSKRRAEYVEECAYYHIVGLPNFHVVEKNMRASQLGRLNSPVTKRVWRVVNRVIFDLDKQNAHGSVPRMASHVADNG